jgi:hypothetical protein
VVSPKTPKIAEEFMVARPNVYWKYPLAVGHCSETDGLPCTNTQIPGAPHRRLARPPYLAIAEKRVYITPIDMEDDTLTKQNQEKVAAIALRYGYIAQLQIHKHLHLP